MINIEHVRLDNDPQEQDRKVHSLCEHCEEPIYIGENYYKVGVENYHVECIKECERTAGE